MTKLTIPRTDRHSRRTPTGVVLELVGDDVGQPPRYLGPRWSRMTLDERFRYGIAGAMSDAELERLWERTA